MKKSILAIRISKNGKNHCSPCCCYSVLLPRIRQISRSTFLNNLDISLALLIPQVFLFLNNFSEVMFQFIKVNWKCVFILIKLAHGTDVWNSLSSACTSMWNYSIQLSNVWNKFYRTTYHLQQFRVNKLSTFFKREASMFSLASFFEFFQLWPETLQCVEKVLHLFLFIAFDRQIITFFQFSL